MANSVLNIRLLIALFWTALAIPAFAQGTQVAFGSAPQDTSQPVEATSDELAVDEATGQAVFTGNVVISQGDMRLSAPRVEVTYIQDESKIDQVVATGGVTIVSGPDAAESQNAVYDLTAGTIVMTGDVLMTQGPQIISGEKLTIYLDDGRAQMSGRVRTVLQGNN